MATILLVEDHAVTQRVLSKRLRNGGYEVITADNGFQALDQLAAMPVDLIISDIAMPEMDGLELLRRVRGETRYQHLPVIVLTTSVLDHHRQEAAEIGISGFLEKPVSSWELDETVKRILCK